MGVAGDQCPRVGLTPHPPPGPAASVGSPDGALGRRDLSHAGPLRPSLDCSFPAASHATRLPAVFHPSEAGETSCWLIGLAAFPRWRRVSFMEMSVVLAQRSSGGRRGAGLGHRSSRHLSLNPHTRLKRREPRSGAKVPRRLTGRSGLALATWPRFPEIQVAARGHRGMPPRPHEDELQGGWPG